MLREPMALSRMHRAYNLTISAVFVCTASGIAAAAPQDVPPADIVYRAQGTNCPSREEFVVAVQEALAVSDLQLPRDERQFTVTLEDHRARLEVREKGGVLSSHDVRGSNCSEVGSAVALSLVLALSPSAPADATAAGDWLSEPDLQPSSSRPPEPSRSKPAIGLAVLGLSGPTPLALGGNLFWDSPHGLGTLIAPQVRFGVAYLETVTPHTFSLSSYANPVPVSVTTVRVHWQWYLARAELCGLHITASTSAYGLRVCAAMEGGIIVSRPSVLESSRSARKVWLAPGLGARAFWKVAGVIFELGTGLSFPLVRYKYYLDDYQGGSSAVATSDVYQLQPVGWVFSLGGAYGFP